MLITVQLSKDLTGFGWFFGCNFFFFSPKLPSAENILWWLSFAIAG